MRHLLLIPAVVALVASAGCNLIPGATGPKVRVSGKLYVPSGQVSMVAAGAGNLVAAGGGNVVPTGGGSYILFAASGEGVASNGRLTAKSWPLPTTSVPVNCDGGGNWMVELSGGVYSANTDAGGLPSVIVAGAAASTMELDAANHMVAAKVFSGITPVDGAKILDAITKIRPLVKASLNVMDQAAWAKAYDETANADVKAALGM